MLEEYLKIHTEAALKNGSRFLVWDKSAEEWKVMANKRDHHAECVYAGSQLSLALKELEKGKYYLTEA